MLPAPSHGWFRRERSAERWNSTNVPVGGSQRVAAATRVATSRAAVSSGPEAGIRLKAKGPELGQGEELVDIFGVPSQADEAPELFDALVRATAPDEPLDPREPAATADRQQEQILDAQARCSVSRGPERESRRL